MLDKPSTKIEEYLKKISPKYYWLVAAILAMISYLLIFSVSEMLQNGRSTIVRMDMEYQYIPCFEYLMEVIKGNHGYWFSWTNFMGFNNSGMFAYMCLSPFNLLLLFFGKSHVLTAITLIVVLKCAASAAFMQRFLSYFLRSNRISTVIFAVCYSLCGYQIAYYCVMNFTDAIYLLPLVMLSIVKLIRENKVGLLVISYFLLFFSCFYMGYMIGIGSFFLGAGYYTYTFYKRNKRLNVMVAVRYAYSVVTAILMTALIWLPAVIQLLKYGEEDYTNSSMWKTNIVLILNNFLVGEYQDLDGYTPYVYCGVITFLFAFSYFFNKKIKKKEKIFSVSMVVLFVLLMVMPALNIFMHAFDTPQMFGYRFAFILSFVMCVIACRESAFYRSIDKRTIGYFVLLCSVIFAVSAILYRNENNWQNCNRIDVAVVNVIVIALWILIFILGKKRKTDRFTYNVILIFMAVCELTVNAVMFFRSSKDYNCGNEAYTYSRIAKDNTLKQIDFPKENEFFRLEMMSEIHPNAGFEDEFYSTGSSCSVAHNDLFMALHNLGVSEKYHTIVGKGMSPFLRSVLGVKYYSNYEIEVMDGFTWCENDSKNLIARYYHDKGKRGTSIVAENEKYLSLGFMVKDDIKNVTFSESPFDNQNLIASKMCGCDVKLYDEVPFEFDSLEGDFIKYKRGESEELDRLIGDLDMEDGYLFISEKGQIRPDNLDEATYNYSDDKSYVCRFNAKDKGKPVYGYFGRDFKYGSYSVLLTEDETDVLENSGITHKLSNSYITELGHNESNDYEIDVKLPDGVNKDYCRSVQFAEYNENEFEKTYDILSQNQLELEEFSDGYVKGTIDAKDAGVMFTSIPFDDGWKVYVDNSPVSAISLLEGAFMGVDLDEGKHIIEMEYVPAGRTCGVILSGLGCVLFAGLLIYRGRKNAR